LTTSAKQYPVARLAMSVNAMVELHKKLTRMLQQLEAEGVVHRAEPASTKAHLFN
jgi:DNA-binding HxlR family transcriptional regulator